MRDHPMTPLRVTLALMLVIVVVVLAAGCAEGPHEEKNVTIFPILLTEISHGNISDIHRNGSPYNVPTLVYGDEARKNILLQIAPNLVYEQNMAEWKKKLSISLVILIDPNYPADKNSRQFIRDQLICFNTILSPEKAVIKLNITNSPGETGGEYVHANIILNQSAPTGVVDQYLRKIEQRYSNEVIGWVELMNIEKIATLKDVQRIELINPNGMTTIDSWHECRNGTMVYVQLGHENSPVVVTRVSPSSQP